MKTMLISLIALVGAVALFRTITLDFLDFDSDQFDITWDDITDDLWP